MLDEPTDGLDPNQKHHVRNLINDMGKKKAIIISTHILEEVDAVCSRACIIARGKKIIDKEQTQGMITTSGEIALKKGYHHFRLLVVIYEGFQRVKQNNFSIVKDFCGHGIGRDFHEAPSVLHYGTKDHGLKLKEGMIFTIEPMLNSGTDKVKILNDGWTAVTKDRKLSAQFEHTIGVTKNGYEIFTLSPKNYHKPPY
mgnify:CR=1 FL=1